MTTQSNALDVIAYWKSACETANGMVLALMGDCAGLRADKTALTAERDALRVALRETREALAGITPPEGDDYWCPQCHEALGGSRVTYQERCDTCGSPVSVADGEEFNIARAVLARHAALAGGEVPRG